MFVLLWTSGFLVGAIGVRHVAPMTLLAWRFVIAAIALSAIAIITRAPWPNARQCAQLAVTGAVLQAIQFGCAYYAFSLGLTAALAALVASAAPLLVAAGASTLLGEKLRPGQWLGLLIGLAGVGVALADSVVAHGQLAPILFSVLAMSGLAGGTLLQRRFSQQMDLRSGGAVQLLAASVLIVPIAALTSGLSLPGAWGAIGPLLWLSLVSSVAAMTLLYWLLRQGSSANTASLLYLVPPLTAILGVPILGQPIRPIAVIGFAISLVGVHLARRRSRARHVWRQATRPSD